ncbi:MAG: glycosyltransferase family 4 protein [Candidatus Omnitrophica bacterium]|jgi:glycosyltransferase involved in cell wall biosynthesis|nr:glycosyltransferase family 4 protein [Candidatus Omnitrophota bacterium]
MKICTITNAFTPEKTTAPAKIGGAETCAERISRGLLEKGYNVIVITQRPYQGLSSLLPKLTIQEGLRVYSFYPLNIFSIYSTHQKSLIAKGLWRIIDLINPLPAIFAWLIVQKEKPDIIHNHILHGFSPFFLLRLLKSTKIPIVQSLHSYGYLCLRCDFLRSNGKICQNPPVLCRMFIALSRILIQKTISTVISPSEFCLKLYRDHGFFNNTVCRVLPNGIDTDPENPHQKINDNLFRILYAGRLVKIKGVHILIKAFRNITSPNARLNIVGEGFFERDLRALAGNDQRIAFLGKIPWIELKKRYQESDVTVMPSIYYEILGNVVLESAAAGTPVIGSRIGGISELIKDGFNGYLVPPDDTEQLHEKIEKLISNPRLKEKMSENAFLDSQKYSIQNHVSDIEKIYLSLKNV